MCGLTGFLSDSSIKSNNFKGEYSGDFEGVINNLERRYNNTKSSHAREWIQQYMAVQDCFKCSGFRLKPEHLSVFVDNKNISDLTDQYNNYIYPKPTENLSEEWIKKNRFQIFH